MTTPEQWPDHWFEHWSERGPDRGPDHGPDYGEDLPGGGEDETLDLLLAEAAEAAPLSGQLAEPSSIRTAVIEVPRGPDVLLAAKQVERRRRLLAGSVAVAAGLLLVAAVGGTATGAWRLQLPSIRGERVDTVPATQDTEKAKQDADKATWTATKVLAGMDSDEVSYLEEPDVGGTGMITDSDELVATWRFASGPIKERDPDRPRSWPEADRSLRVAADWNEPYRWVVELGGPEAKPLGSDRASDWTVLGEVEVAEPGERAMLQAKPSEADGWLVAAVLPPGAEAVQFRVAGTNQGINAPQWSTQCFDLPEELKGRWGGEGTPSSGDGLCAGQPLSLVVVIARFVLDGDRPPLDAVTYVDKTGEFVVVEAKPAKEDGD